MLLPGTATATRCRTDVQVCKVASGAFVLRTRCLPHASDCPRQHVIRRRGWQREPDFRRRCSAQQRSPRHSSSLHRLGYDTLTAVCQISLDGIDTRTRCGLDAQESCACDAAPPVGSCSTGRRHAQPRRRPSEMTVAPCGSRERAAGGSPLTSVDRGRRSRKADACSRAEAGGA